MTVKMAASIVEHGEDAFRKLFKFYKRRNPPPDFSEVINFSKPLNNDKVFHCELNSSPLNEEEVSNAGLKPVKDWRAFGLHGYPGFIFISNPFLPGSQQYWVKQCLKNYPQKPNVCNLDMHMSPAETENIWEKSIDAIQRKGSGKREPKTLLEKLRWVTLGYHYDWNSKTYSPDHFTPFPTELHSLSHKVAAACGFPGFNAEAGILNYYLSDSSLGIHVDESELDHTRPLLSLSFGQTAVFLLGGAKREDRPTAMFMHSGDIMVMSGPSRLLYHAVPCIVPAPAGNPLPSCLSQTLKSEPQNDDIIQNVNEGDWKVCSWYLQTSRVNVTVRQVLGSGQTFPSTETLSGAAHTSTDSCQKSDEDCEAATHKKRKTESAYERDS
ncbi:alkylated DNA repair protein alkB-like protein 1 [Triplophysa rosa]|uniref:Nucleic acid dioxygenase ALKBH1 n=2 Tax=Triplophysa rosa TaxID=992332 RepID=A0A9W7TSG4_TRIRA|nr:alkylated DNA repair protein alkB-like protein 1 [Triplophysa rosa]